MNRCSQLNLTKSTARHTPRIHSKSSHRFAPAFIKIALCQIGRIEIDHVRSRSSERQTIELCLFLGKSVNPFTNFRSAKEIPWSSGVKGIVLADGCLLSSTTIPSAREAFLTQSPVFICKSLIVIFNMCSMCNVLINHARVLLKWRELQDQTVEGSL